MFQVRENSTNDSGLIVSGNIKIGAKSGVAGSGFLQVTSSTNSSSISTGSIITAGGVGIAQNAYIGGDVDIGGILQTGNIAPDTSSSRNIGTISNKYDGVYANTFYGNIQGNVSGTVSGRAGSADKLCQQFIQYSVHSVQYTVHRQCLWAL